ncbi:hypothetical protein [Pedobacter sp. Leaf194]|uniref:hypothetical protein n=1 Tax=Pedobacter sp. Leaf194 TaxID=1736297 RepID=UPI0007024FE4|nr:hypothetical protein [Pedobacter sp. Leaf194]KQS37016.1 hypothetical protein ASG14_08295 [Pedobacter sp. Leaf194]RYD75316.1 MAG: hypothetical protein EOP55_13685 [Sphingobacteriales bacterium]
MKFPLYLYYEILIRLEEFVPNIGDYMSATEKENDCLIKTTTGQLLVPKAILMKQFDDPNFISKSEMVQLGQNFQLGGRLYNKL